MTTTCRLSFLLLATFLCTCNAVAAKNKNDHSDYVTIKGRADSYINIIAPTSYTTWYIRAKHEIIWKDNLTENVKIELLSESGFVRKTLAASTPSDGSFFWEITDVAFGFSYKIRITGVSSGISQTSPKFRIEQGWWIFVKEPNKNTVWEAGTIQNITWNDAYSEKVDIYLYKDHNRLLQVASTDNDGIYDWIVPSNLSPGDDYSMYFESKTNGYAQGWSSAFTITAAQSSISVTSPSSGTIWHTGTSHNITWEDNISENVKIELWSSEGDKLLEISPSTPSDGSYNWAIPATVPNYNLCKIKIISTANNSVVGWSDVFRINNIEISPASRNVSNAAGSTSFNVTSNVSWTVSDNAGWLTATKDGFSIAVKYDANPTSSPRTATITVTGGGITKTVKVTQAAGSCAISVTPANRSVGAAKGTTTFNVTSNVGWSVSDNAGWLTATKNGNTVNVNYNANTATTQRKATITVAGGGCSETVTVTQSGAACAISVTPASRNVDAAKGTTSFSVTSNVGWSVSDNAGWLTATKNGNTINVNFNANTATTQRTANITVSGGNCTETVTVTQSGAACNISVTPASRSVGSSSGTTTFSVTANVSWTVSDNVGWLTVSKSGNSINVSYEANPTTSTRSATITVAGGGCSKTVTVTQAGADCSISVTPANRSVGSSSGTTTFSVTSNVSWSVSDDADWLTASKSGNSINVSYDANPTIDARTATLTVAGGGCSKTVTVTQAGADCSISVTPASRSVGSSSGTTTFSVTSNVTWSVSDNAAWLTASKSGNSINVSYDANPTISTRSATITVAGGGCSKTVTVTQAGADCSISVTPASRSVGSSSGTTSFSVTSNVSWSVSDDADWLTASKSGNSINMSYDANPTIDARTATLTVAGGGCSESITLTQSGEDCNISVTPLGRTVDPSAGTTTFVVTANVEWSVSDDADWLDAIKNGNSIEVGFDANLTLEHRTANITVSGGGCQEIVTVTQSSEACNIIITPLSHSVSSDAGTAIFNVTSNVIWSVTDDADWLTATKNGPSIELSFEANTTASPRTANIIVSGGGCTEILSLDQEPATGLTLSVSKATITLNKEVGSNATFEITSNGEWTVEFDSEWFICVPASGANNGIVTVVALMSNEGASESRTGMVRVVLEEEIEEQVKVTQFGEQITFSSSAPELILGALLGSSRSFSIEANIEWTLETTAAWFTVTPTSGSDTTEIVIEVSESNNTGMVRADTIIAKGGGLELRIIVRQDFMTSVMEQISSNMILYPNPADQELIVDLGAELENFIVRISDKRGAVIYLHKVDRSRKLSIDLTSYKYGTYQIEIIHGNSRITKAFVKL